MYKKNASFGKRSAKHVMFIRLVARMELTIWVKAKAGTLQPLK